MIDPVPPSIDQIASMSVPELLALPMGSTWRRVAALAISFAVTQHPGGIYLRKLLDLPIPPRPAHEGAPLTIGDLQTVVHVALVLALPVYLQNNVPDADAGRALLAVLQGLPTALIAAGITDPLPEGVTVKKA